VHVHIGFSDPLGVDNLAVLRDQDRAVQKTALLVARNKFIDSRYFVRSDIRRGTPS
jgi:hypothetical protein